MKKYIFFTNEMEAKPPTHHKKGITSRKSVLTRSLKAIQSNIYKVISNVNFLREKKTYNRRGLACNWRRCLKLHEN